MAVHRILTTAITIIAFLFMYASTQATQESILWKLGVRAGTAVQFHTAGFSSFPPINLPPLAAPFTATSGIAFTGGAEAQYRLFPWLYIGLAGDVRFWKSSFTSQEETTLGDGLPATFTHGLSGMITSLGVTPSLTMPLFADLSVDAGARLSMTAAGDFTKTLSISRGELTSPQTIGPIAVENIRSMGAELSVALRYTIPLQGRLSLVPEARFYTSLTSLRSDVPWSFRGIQGGIAVFYNVPAPPIVVRDTLYRRDTINALVVGLESERIVLASATQRERREERDGFLFVTTEIAESYTRGIPKPAPLFIAAVDVKFVQKDGTETDATTISIEEIVERQYVPLLPYIFFDEGSPVLPKRYRHPRNNADTLDFPNPVLDVYYSMIDTIGARMQQMPNVVLNLTGCNANVRKESNNLALSLQRAETVRNYLVQQWNIAPERVTVQAQNLPGNTSALDREAGLEENRRVELTASDNRIFAPVVLTDTLILADPPRVRFYPDITSEAGVASWSLEVQARGKPLKIFSDTTHPPAVMEWDIAATPAATSLLGDTLPMQYIFGAVDREGYMSQTQSGNIRFQEAKHSKQKAVSLRSSERFSLILFDFDTAELTEENKQILRRVQSKLSSQYRILVVGSTDATGSEEYNRELSLRRAQTIARFLRIPSNDIQGIGVDGDSFPQLLPEGRLYSRRVEVLLLPQ